ncbi:hypothetical protein RJ640_001548 [Escallonia rubra]|uniref:Retrotransposon gag domain-containing protein n=1 Tax=Escallonia rubra TaxID=112253 RepID=A0AA88U1T9_9ASTE|nr:hypothetical protein RJ640_001548 [Escallonia rubra]
MVKRTLSIEEEHALTWARFQEIFLGNYFPRNVKDGMVEVFLRLEQEEDKTVKDYEARFSRLSTFVTHVIDTVERRATRFKNGLWYKIRKCLTAVTLDTYGQVLDKAHRVDKYVEAGRKYYKEQRQKRGREESSSKINDVVQPKSRNNNLAIKEPLENTQGPIEACKTCGKNHRDTYGQVLDKAQRVEKDVEARRKYYKEQRQKRGRENSSSKGNDVVQPKS